MKLFLSILMMSIASILVKAGGKLQAEKTQRQQLELKCPNEDSNNVFQRESTVNETVIPCTTDDDCKSLTTRDGSAPCCLHPYCICQSSVHDDDTATCVGPDQSKHATVTLSPMTIKFLLGHRDRNRRVQERQVNLVEVIKEFLLKAYSTVLPSHQQPSGLEMLVLSNLNAEKVDVLTLQLLESLYFAPNVTTPPLQETLNGVSQAALESSDFIHALSNSTDPVLSKWCSKVLVEFTELQGNAAPQDDSGNGDDDRTWLAIVASVSAVLICLTILGFVFMVFPRCFKRKKELKKTDCRLSATEEQSNELSGTSSEEPSSQWDSPFENDAISSISGDSSYYDGDI